MDSDPNYCHDSWSFRGIMKAGEKLVEGCIVFGKSVQDQLLWQVEINGLRVEHQFCLHMCD